MRVNMKVIQTRQLSNLFGHFDQFIVTNIDQSQCMQGLKESETRLREKGANLRVTIVIIRENEGENITEIAADERGAELFEIGLIDGRDIGS